MKWNYSIIAAGWLNYKRERNYSASPSRLFDGEAASTEMVFHIKMRLCNWSYTSFQSWSRGQSRGWSKGPFKPLTPLSLWPEHKRGLQIILMCNQIIFSVKNQCQVWRGRSWRLSTAVKATLWFPLLFCREKQEEEKNTHTQLLVNELASLPSPLAPPLFHTRGADKVACWVDFGLKEKYVLQY